LRLRFEGEWTIFWTVEFGWCQFLLCTRKQMCTFHTSWYLMSLRTFSRFLSVIATMLMTVDVAVAEELTTLKKCKLMPAEWADGDVFLIQTADGASHTIRLYTVPIASLINRFTAVGRLMPNSAKSSSASFFFFASIRALIVVVILFGSSAFFMGQRNILQFAWRGHGPRPTDLQRSKPLL